MTRRTQTPNRDQQVSTMDNVMADSRNRYFHCRIICPVVRKLNLNRCVVVIWWNLPNYMILQFLISGFTSIPYKNCKTIVLYSTPTKKGLSAQLLNYNLPKFRFSYSPDHLGTQIFWGDNFLSKLFNSDKLGTVYVTL